MIFIGREKNKIKTPIAGINQSINFINLDEKLKTTSSWEIL